MRSAIYVSNTSSVASIASGSTLPLGSIVRRSGCCLDLNGSSINATGTGDYAVAANFTIVPSASDTVTIQAYNNGVAIPGAKAVVNTDVVTTVPILFIVKNACCVLSSNVTFAVTTATATTTVTMSNCAVECVKL